ncbi:MAG: 2-succinyl-6-hydroxy-2,4-cyclohexadiene-1-carboxylate synthase [Pseudanabaena sp.]|nr:MAG: 2-succinyl-6-hydroxy-2,4-cyclohexadiene-1-carboxylate synthase [Pseudanabaena sp.]
MGDRDEFKSVIAVLSNYFYCVAIDLLGHGETRAVGAIALDSDYTMASTANLIIKFLDKLHLKPCHLVGYSMGGRLALYLAIFYPEYFRKAAIESASAGLTSESARLSRQEQDFLLAHKLETMKPSFDGVAALHHQNLEQTKFFELFLESWYQQSIFGNLRSHPNFPQMLAQRLNNSPLELARSLRNLGLGMQRSLCKKLAEIDIPLLLVVGELDQKFIEINQQIAEQVRFAKLEIIANCGHNTHFENPELFAQKIIDFLQQ